MLEADGKKWRVDLIPPNQRIDSMEMSLSGKIFGKDIGGLEIGFDERMRKDNV